MSQFYAELRRMLGADSGEMAWFKDLEKNLIDLEALIPANAIRPRVYIEERHQPPTAAGAWVPILVRLAGGEPFLLPPGSRSHEVSWEEVMEFDAQMVVYSIAGLGLKMRPEEYLEVEGWDKTEAARKKAVFSFDDKLLNPVSPRLIEGARLLQQLMGEIYWGWGKATSPALRRLDL